MKKFCDKLIGLRREKGFSQEQLAEYLDVSRQSVSKWEADKTMPEISKLIAISELFGVSLDYLLIDDCDNRNGRFANAVDNSGKSTDTGAEDSAAGKQQETETAGTESSLCSDGELKESLNEIKEFIGYAKGYEYKSRASVFGIPLIHVKFAGRNGKVRLKDAAVGIIAVGNLAVGILSAGIFSAGVISFGVISLGLLFSLGVISLGGLSVGIVAFGVISGGISSMGIYSTGAAAVAKEIATGISVSGKTAAGMQGADISGWNMTVTDSLTSKEAMREFILTYNPGLPKWILNFLTFIYK